MADGRRDPLFLFASSGFHAALFLVALVVVLYRGGNTGFEVGSISLVGGMLLYGLLLFGTLVGTRVGLTRLRTTLYDATGGEVLAAGAVAGTIAALVVTGALVLFESVAIFMAIGLYSAEEVLWLAWMATWYVVPAAVIGCVIGIVAIAIDFAIVVVVRQALGPEVDHRPERQ